MGRSLQEWIHRLDEGAGSRWIRVGCALVAFLSLAGLWTRFEAQTLRHPEAMDAAQVGRNLAEGRGFTTRWIRPLGLNLRARDSGALDVGRAFPDVSQAPVQAWLWAVAFRCVPDPVRHAPPTPDGHLPLEGVIVTVQFGLFLVVLILTFRLARRLFDETAAWITVLALAGSARWWALADSGLPVLLLSLELLVLTGWLLRWERGVREGGWGLGSLLGGALLGGILLGGVVLTQYAFLALVPAFLVFVGGATPRARAACLATGLAGLVLVVTPWLARNHALTGHAFGTAGFAVYQDTVRFPQDRLDRTLLPYDMTVPEDINKYSLTEHRWKLVEGLEEGLFERLPHFGGTWLAALALGGLCLRFRQPGVSRLRGFLVMGLLGLGLAQALGHTSRAGLEAAVGQWDWTLPLAPLVLAFGGGLLGLLLDQMQLDSIRGRQLVAGFCGFVLCLPVLFRFLDRETGGPAYPPYHPGLIGQLRDWVPPEEWMMSDQPWAVAWYADRECVSLTWDPDQQFRSLNEARPLAAVYLTQITLDRPMVSGLVRAADGGWGQFVLNVLLREEVPDGFPLRNAFIEWYPDQFLLAAEPRWMEKPPPAAPEQ